MRAAEIVLMRTATEWQEPCRRLIVVARRELAEPFASPTSLDQAAADGLRRPNRAFGVPATAEKIQLFHVGCSTFLRLLAFGFVFYGCFINQHDGNVVADRVNALALDALQTAAVGFDFHLCLAGRAGQYFQ